MFGVATARSRHLMARVFRVVHRIAYRIWLGLLGARVALLVALLFVVIADAAISQAHAQTSARQTTKAQAAASAEAQTNLYMYGIKCYVANAASAADQRYNRAGANSAALRAMAKKSYDLIWRLGPVIGKSNTLIQEDIDSYQNLLSETYVRDDAFFQRVRYECGRLGLM